MGKKKKSFHFILIFIKLSDALTEEEVCPGERIRFLNSFGAGIDREGWFEIFLPHSGA